MHKCAYTNREYKRQEDDQLRYDSQVQNARDSSITVGTIRKPIQLKGDKDQLGPWNCPDQEIHKVRSILHLPLPYARRALYYEYIVKTRPISSSE